jgi:hypothetical protein
MEGFGFPLMILGCIVAFIGAIRLLIAAFGSSVLWGLGVLLIHPIVLVYVILNWHEAKGPFINYLVGVGIILLSSQLTF